MSFKVRKAVKEDLVFVSSIVEEIAYWAKFRSTGVTTRTTMYVQQKIEEGLALIALDAKGDWVGFCYLETWEHEKYVANSGLVVLPEFRNTGLAFQLKQMALQVAARKYPRAKVFSLTTSLSVAKINHELGYKVVSHDQLLEDEYFIKGCGQVLDYPKMVQTHAGDSECFIMVYDPAVMQLKKVS